MEGEVATHHEPAKGKDKDHTEEAKPVKDKKEKKPKKEKKEKSKDKEKEKVGEITDAAKLRAKLEKLDAKIDDLKAKKQEIVARLLQLEGTSPAGGEAAPQPVTSG
ncbi:hypothetical protein BDA96_07G129700 [Sorghum bicolor]|uniref:KED-like protein n=2 Tax=Sorghum bicolor TaxID=4558 RepID=A0A921QK83_SORBI|nr:protein PXR1 [Sorghum bicolor]XP_021321573.1 protein PXR1 [Sorghum bicolor]KAG0523519.1 hypothetical protein BDA96_07G129700 [Sorghum bicolor]KXG25104.1 hypothetical protein SORBI_3007G120600 [Sorghum bicolor]|eukprot:XP_021321572.1 protein PXR1 [Sorghum bicolor]